MLGASACSGVTVSSDTQLTRIAPPAVGIADVSIVVTMANGTACSVGKRLSSGHKCIESSGLRAQARSAPGKSSRHAIERQLCEREAETSLDLAELGGHERVLSL